MATIPKFNETSSGEARFNVVNAASDSDDLRREQARSQVLDLLREYRSPQDAYRVLPALERLRDQCRQDLAVVGGRQEAQADPSDAELIPLSRVVKDHIVKVYQAMGRNKTQAARVLEIDIKTLYNKLKRYGVK